MSWPVRPQLLHVRVPVMRVPSPRDHLRTAPQRYFSRTSLLACTLWRRVRPQELIAGWGAQLSTVQESGSAEVIRVIWGDLPVM